MTGTRTDTRTGTPTRSAPGSGGQVEALIREARRFQRRRWWGRGALAAAVLVVAGILLSQVQGGAPTALRPEPFRPASPPVAHVFSGPFLGPATSLVLTGPTSVAAGAADDVFFTDGNRVDQVDHATGDVLVVAGTGVNGFSGDGGPGPRAELSFPSGIALAPDGDVYLVDASNRIRRISATTGIITTVAGNGLTGDAGHGGPAVRADLDLTGAGGSGGLDGPIAVDGDLYIADTGNDEVQKVSATTGIITPVAGTAGIGSPGEPALPCAPEAITVDRSSNLFITTACGSISEVSARTGLISTIFRVGQVPALASEGTPHDPVDLGLAADGNLLVIGSTSRRLLEIAPTTDKVTLAAGTGSQTVWTAGATAGDGGPAATATFGNVVGLTMDAHGDIFVADLFDNAIREIDPRTGLISLVAGQIPTSPAAGHCC